MKYRMIVAALCAAAGLSGCSIVKHELRTGGGYAGHLLDKHMIDAQGSKKVQLLRATIIVALASRVAVGTLQDGDDGDEFIKRIQVVNREINYLAGDIYPIAGKTHCMGVESGGCDSRAVFFESNLPQLEYKVVRMLMAALPQKEAAAFAAEATGGNVWSAAFKFIKLGFRGLDGGHRGAAAFRSSTEILAKALSTDPCLTTADARKCLDLTDLDPTFRMVSPGKLDENKIDQNLLSIYFEMMRTSCSLLPLSSDPEDNSDDRETECNDLALVPKLRPMSLRPPS